jgi:hypothetical protein
LRLRRVVFSARPARENCFHFLLICLDAERKIVYIPKIKGILKIQEKLEGGKKMKRTICVAAIVGLTLIGSGALYSQTVYTGLIFDAQSLPFVPSASVKILDEDGREVYGSAYVSKEWAEKQGIVGYAKSLEDAKANQRVAGNPLVFKVMKVTGPNNKDLVISNEDARKVRDLAKNINFLDKAKVMVVVP